MAKFEDAAGKPISDPVLQAGVVVRFITGSLVEVATPNDKPGESVVVDPCVSPYRHIFADKLGHPVMLHVFVNQERQDVEAMVSCVTPGSM